MTTALALDPGRRARYAQGAGIYRIPPAAVARPGTLEQLREVIGLAVAHRWSVTPRGAGTAMDGSNVGEGVIIDLTAFNPGQVHVEATSQRAMVSPSTALSQLNAAAAVFGLRLPPDPSSGGWATLGGMVSTNASGARSARYGSIRKWVTALTLETIDGPLRLVRGTPPDPHHPAVQRWNSDVAPRLNASGAMIRERFPKVRKNSAGYALDRWLESGDLIDIVIGSEGTLGIVTDIECRLDPIPAHRVSLRLLVRSRAALVPLIDALHAIHATSIEFLDRTFLQLVDPQLAGSAAPLIGESGGVILSDLEGDDLQALIALGQRVLSEESDTLLHGELASAPGDIAALWKLRHGASPALARLDDGRRSLQIIEDGAVPIAQLPACLDAIEAASEAEGIAVVLFGHAGDGHVHANLLPDLTSSDWEARVARIYHRVSAAVIALGGTLSGEHGTGRLRASMMPLQYGDEIVDLFRAVKAAFDPAGMMNPGVIISDGISPFARLKVGAGAAPLPEGAESFLRALEAEARWGEPRWLER